MPEPRAGESEKDFIDRCMAYEDMQRYDPAQREAICHSIWREHQHKGTAELRIEGPPQAMEEFKNLLRAAGIAYREG